MALGVSRSNVLNKKTRSSEWAVLRKSPPKLDDADLKDTIACVVKYQATYGYRRVKNRHCKQKLNMESLSDFLEQ
jgi:hypothetical protein